MSASEHSRSDRIHGSLQSAFAAKPKKTFAVFKQSDSKLKDR